MVSDFGAYQPTLIERIEDACCARWPFLLAAAATLGYCFVGAL